MRGIAEHAACPILQSGRMNCVLGQRSELRKGFPLSACQLLCGPCQLRGCQNVRNASTPSWSANRGHSCSSGSLSPIVFRHENTFLTGCAQQPVVEPFACKSWPSVRRAGGFASLGTTNHCTCVKSQDQNLQVSTWLGIGFSRCLSQWPPKRSQLEAAALRQAKRSRPAVGPRMGLKNGHWTLILYPALAPERGKRELYLGVMEPVDLIARWSQL